MSRPSSFFLTALLTGVCLWCAAGNAPSYELPDLGSPADTLMNRGDERRLGRAFMRSVHEHLAVSDDPLLDHYIANLGTRLTAASDTAGGDFRFFLIDAPMVNAFAGPAGHIGVFTGLLQKARSESELAAVISHEIAHVTQRHLLRTLEARKQQALPTAAMLLAAALLGAQVSSDAGMAIAAGAQGAMLQRQLNFSRAHEKEADRIGIQTLARAGFEPAAMATFFERLGQLNRIDGSSAPEFLRTHPVTSTRIADAEGRARAVRRSMSQQTGSDLDFQLAQVRALAISRSAIRQARSGRTTVPDGSGPAARYAQALHLQQTGKPKAAMRLAQELLKEHPHQAHFIILAAQLERRGGRGKAAAERLKKALDGRGANRPLHLAYAEMLIAIGQPQRALATLAPLAANRKDDTTLYALLEEAAFKAGRKAATHRYRAEKLYAQGDTETAIRQLEIALRSADIPYREATVIQARLETWRAEEKDEKKRKRRF